MINKYLLHFIWKFRLYNAQGLKTDTGESVLVLQPGALNQDAGPDFEAAKIRIGNTLWVGNVELHVKASDWFSHGHQHDRAYDNIILHVVWEADKSVVTLKGEVPILELKEAVSPVLLNKYEALYRSTSDIPCAAMISGVNDLTKHACLSRLLAERWEMKFTEWESLLQQNAGDWRILLYWRLAANFGFKTNASAFLLLARSLPLNILARHHDNLLQIEALLFGQAGLLDGEYHDDYPLLLQKEYRYLKQKHKLKSIPAYLWKFSRMRPANFPTIRIAQFAVLVHRSLALFTQIVNASALTELTKLFDVSASSYWDNHVHFDKQQQNSESKHLGTLSIQNIIINTVAPLRFMYTQCSGLGDYCETSVQLLEQSAPEKNSILSFWEKYGWWAENAAQSQALIQLYNHYCQPKKCLHCIIGHSLLRP